MCKQSLFLSVAVAAIALSTACKKENNAVNDRPLTAGAVVQTCTTVHNCGDSTITGVITSNLYLGDCKIYKLSGIVYVSNNATLTIAPGALVQGIKGAPGGTLVITRGSKLIAAGIPNNPILFTSDQATPASGDWGGIVLLGRADINQGDTARVEGIGGTPPASPYYGGSVNTDNSGILTYVRIEYAGYELSTDNELNGLTLAGVGSGTTIDHVEVYKSKDDAFEFFGGTVNASFLIAYHPLDDMFDFDNGYTGTITYALGVSDPTRADKSQSNGIECDGNASGDSTLLPRTKPVLNHFTIIGQQTAAAASITNGAPSGTGRYGRGAHFRRTTRFDLRNSVVMGFMKGISLEGNPGVVSDYLRDLCTMDNNLVHAFVTAGTPWAPYMWEEMPSSPIVYNKAVLSNLDYGGANPNTGINLVSPFTGNYFPAATSHARTFAAGAFTYGGVDWTACFGRID